MPSTRRTGVLFPATSQQNTVKTDFSTNLATAPTHPQKKCPEEDKPLPGTNLTFSLQPITNQKRFAPDCNRFFSVACGNRHDHFVMLDGRRMSMAVMMTVSMSAATATAAFRLAATATLFAEPVTRVTTLEDSAEQALLLAAGIAAFGSRCTARLRFAARFGLAAGSRFRLAANFRLAALRCRATALRLAAAIFVKEVKQSGVSTLGAGTTDQHRGR